MVFCVNYMALNQVIVLNKFPMPIAEEPIDELHGACIFENWIYDQGLNKSEW